MGGFDGECLHSSVVLLTCEAGGSFEFDDEICGGRINLGPVRRELERDSGRGYRQPT